ncbi:hypothetical protein M514_13274 [Trichuris suis]|uniref:Uncharacterized protein n=1 Tax=Trichuris suis TaxID=68888 RepID=A0A085MPZ1_9BILA|nr:hypothetical protein M514_13274 [Trichuris suis]
MRSKKISAQDSFWHGCDEEFERISATQAEIQLHELVRLKNVDECTVSCSELGNVGKGSAADGRAHGEN